MILVVDDSEFMRETVTATLSIFNYEAMSASDGLDALKKYESGEFELIITDINMPELDGIGLIKEIRKKNQDIPIIVLTTESEDDIKTEALEIGADGWLVKPFQPPQLLSMIRELL